MSNSFFSTYIVYVLAGKGQKFSVGGVILLVVYIIVKMITQGRHELPDVVCWVCWVPLWL